MKLLDIKDANESRDPRLYVGFQAALFYWAYGAWLVVALLNTSVLNPYFGKHNIVYYAVAVCFIIVELLNLKNESCKGLLFLALLAAMNIQTFIFGHNELLIFSMLLVCGRRADFRKVIRITVATSTIVSVALAILCCAGLIPDVTNVRVDGTVRHSLGYSYVTYLSYVYLNVAFLILYRKVIESRLRLQDVIMLMAVNIVIYLVCQARNAFLIVTVATVVIIAINWAVRSKKGLRFVRRVWAIGKRFAVWAFPFMAIFSLMLALLYLVAPQSWGSVFLDGLLSTRLQKMAHAIKMMGLPLIGGTNTTLSDVLVIDNAYLRIIYEHGFVALVIILAMWTYAMRKACQAGDSCLVWLMVLVACCAVVDAQLISFQQNTFLFVIAWCMPGGVVQFKQSRLAESDGY